MSTRKNTKNYGFPSYEDARKIVEGLNIRSAKEYEKRYKESEVPLPANPQCTYSESWKPNNGWHGFVKKKDVFNFLSFDEAKIRIIKHGITSIEEYKRSYKIADPRLPSHPERIYKQEWNDKGKFRGLIGCQDGMPMRDLFEVIKFNRKNKVDTVEKYLKYAMIENSMFPLNPARYYQDYWEHINEFDGFFSINRNAKAVNYEKARLVVKLMEIRTVSDYNAKYKSAPIKLPSSPDKKFSKEWDKEGRWICFLWKKEDDEYATYEEASKFILDHKISNRSDYLKKYKLCSKKLPNRPTAFYEKEILKYSKTGAFYFGENTTKFPSYEEASEIAQKFNFMSMQEYQSHYKRSDLLPSNPSMVYVDVWSKNGGARGFLGLDCATILPLRDASKLVQEFKITSRLEYVDLAKRDRRFPARPEKYYLNEWEGFGGWNTFLGVDYLIGWMDYKMAKKTVVDLRIRNSMDYKKKCQLVNGLPANPRVYYSGDWLNWPDFLIPTKVTTFEELKHVIDVLGVKNSVEYKKMRKSYPQIPSKPETKFKEKFIDWYDLCNIPKPYGFEELKSMVQLAKLTSISQYTKWRIKLKDPRVIASPHEHVGYKDLWTNWYDFFGLEVPFKIEHISDDFSKWGQDIVEFSKTALASKEKSTSICRFVRGYVQPGGWRDPESLIFDKNVNIFNYKKFIDNDKYSPETKRKIYKAVEEFLDWIIINRLTDEDPDTGELITPEGVRNRFKNVIGHIVVQQNHSESVKEALCFQFVQELKLWMIPKGAKTFSDLKDLHQFNADWKKVPASLVDKSDPDCVFKEIDETHALIWVPMDWMHFFAMCSVPLRGGQIAFNDSGEGDDYVPDFDGESLVWKKNRGLLAGKTNSQGMIKRYPNNEFGMHSTSNKTSQQGTSSVPWMPIELAYWLVKLRKWQSKYNPLTKPTPWLGCKHANLNETQLKLKGENCFLFRRLGVQECGTFSNRIYTRLAAALYHSQPKGRGLASLEGKSEAVLSKYRSTYSPHSMRVSLITMYVNEYDMDLSIVLKIAGHSSIVMTLYYVKTNGATMRAKMEIGEKKALKEKAFHAKQMIESKRIEEIKPSLIATSKGDLAFINNDRSVGTYLYKDWGICPFAGHRCEDGGAMVNQSRVYGPVPAGYVGMQNCVRCRHFVTGPAWVGGLLSLSNEITLALTIEQSNVDSSFEELEKIKLEVESEDEKRYELEKKGLGYDADIVSKLKLLERQAYSEYERIGLKMDMLYNDLGATSTLIKKCLDVLDKEPSKMKKSVVV